MVVLEVEVTVIMALMEHCPQGNPDQAQLKPPWDYNQEHYLIMHIACQPPQLLLNHRRCHKKCITVYLVGAPQTIHPIQLP